MSRLGGVHRGKCQPTHNPRQFGDVSLIDSLERLKRKASQVEVSASLGAVSEALRLAGGKRLPGILLQ